MPVTVFKNATIYTPHEVISSGALVVEDERIGFIGPAHQLNLPPDAQVVDVRGKNICPGFIDLHIHGAKGVDFMDTGSVEIDKILIHHARHGTTSLLATTMSASHHNLLATCERLGRLAGTGPHILGIHMEGPYLNPEKRGIHQDIQSPSLEEFQVYLEVSDRAIKLLTLAPELPGAEELICCCTQSQIVAAVAHSKAAYDVIQKTKSLGLGHATHFFNTLPPFHHRHPGTVGAVLDDPDFTVELIADGVHLHPVTLRLVYRLKGADKIILASDASAFSGLEPGKYQDSHGTTIMVSDRGITTADGIIAGSNLTLIKAIQNMVNFTDSTLCQAIQMATINPAKLIGADQRKGSLQTGKDADLVVFDESFNVDKVYFRGKPGATP